MQKAADALATLFHAQQQRLVAGQDFGDDDGRPERLRSQADDLRNAIEQLGGKIVDAQARLAAERDRIVRKVEAEQRTRQLATIEVARNQFERSAKELA